MDQDFKQMQSLVKKIDASTKDIHRKINRIQTGDAQVCACSCHNAEVGPKVADEIQDLNVRIGYLEKLVGELLERDRDVGIDQNRVISTYNATDEYKSSRHDARDGRNLENSRRMSREPKARVTSRERSRDAGIQTRRDRSRDAGIQTRRDRSRDAGIQTRRDRSRDAGIQTVSSTSDTDNDHVISSDEEDAEETQVLASGVDKLQARVTQTKSMRQQSASRDTERTVRPSAAQRAPEPKDLSKTVPKDNRGSTQVETSWHTMRGGHIARPNVTPSVESKAPPLPTRTGTPKPGKAPPLPTRTGTPRPVETVYIRSVSDRSGNAGVDIKPGTGDVVPAGHLTEGATSRPETEDVNCEVEVIHQEETRMFARAAEWSHLAQMELDSGKETALAKLGGAHTAICLDISESMVRGNAWRQAKTFLLNYINELTAVSKEHKVTDEYVSLVTFGHETRVVKRMTNKYEELRRAIESVKLGGPSPMYGGLYLALVSLIQSDNWTTTVHGLPVFSKIILVSDGIVTEARQQAGPDITDVKDEQAAHEERSKGPELEKKELRLCPSLMTLQSKQQFTTDLLVPLREVLKRGIDMYCVPVGTANMCVMDTMAAEEGRIWSCEEGTKLGRRYFLTKALGPGIIKGYGIFLLPSFDPNFKTELNISADDRLHMLEIFKETHRRRVAEAARAREIEDTFADTNNPSLPVVGSRVRRGPNWEEDREEDRKGPGTVIGHMRWRDKVWVAWDDGDKIYQYRFGEDDCYDVFPTDNAADARQPDADGSLNVGCVVKPNTLTTVTNPDIQTSDRGVVTNILDSAQVGVRWSSGKKSPHENQGVDFCGPSETPAQVVQTKQLENKPSRQKNKNKK